MKVTVISTSASYTFVDYDVEVVRVRVGSAVSFWRLKLVVLLICTPL